MNPYAIIGGLVGALLWTFAVYHYATGHESRKWELANAQTLIDAKDAAKKEQQRLDDAAYAADREFWNTHPKIVTETATVVKWAIKHVADISGCPTPELISVYNASITGAVPGKAEDPHGADAGPVRAAAGP